MGQLGWVRYARMGSRYEAVAEKAGLALDCAAMSGQFIALAAVLAAALAALGALNIFRFREDRNGNWHPIDPIKFGRPMMRRRRGRAWEYREMTEAEEADWMASVAW